MKCENFVNTYLPAIRASLAKNLLDNGLIQQDVAGKLFVSQTSVAFYKKLLRGKAIEKLDKPKVRNKIDEVAKKLISSTVDKEELEKEYCEICKLIFG